MPFKSKKQKKTIDAAAHNPAFAKKVGINVADAKKMSKHGKGQTKFEEAKDTVEKDEKGNVKSWKHEGDWTKSKGKEGRGKVTNLSDKARRETEKLSKAEKEMAESFEKAISEVKVTSGPNKGKEWSPKTPGPTNKDYKPFDKNGIPSPDDGATAPPPGYKAPKSMKKAEVTPGTTDTTSDDSEITAEAKQTYGGKGPKKTKSEHDAEVKKKKEKEKFKKMAEAFVQIGRLEQMIMEAKKSKCTCETNEDSCKVHGKMEEGLKGGQKKIAKAAPPEDKITGADFKALKGKKKTEEAIDQNKDGKNDFEDVKIARMKAAMKGKSKKVKESWTHDSLAAQLFETDEYMMTLHESLQRKLKG